MGDRSLIAFPPGADVSISEAKPMANIAAVTMVYNEPEYLPIWCRHYAKAVGPENCFIIDHGSDDGSTSSLPNFNVIRKSPRSPKDNEKRTRSRF